MSNKKSLPTSWSDADIERLIKRAQDGLPNNIIAAELQYYHKTKHTESEVAEMRSHLKLADETRKVPERPEEKRPLSASQISRSRKPGTKTSGKKAEALDEVFEDVAAKPAEPVVLPSGALKFTAVYPDMAALKEGGNYIMPGFGACRYNGLQSISIAGMGNMETMTFSALYPAGGNNSTQKFAPVKLKDKGVRLPASPEFFRELLVRMERDMLDTLSFPAKAAPRKEFMEQIIQSADPIRIAVLVRQCFKQTTAATNIEHGNIGLKMLAEEYAASTGIDRKLAYEEFVQASGKPNIDELRIDKALDRGRKPRAP
ncbi:MAG: hypothetical protein DI626_03500 [Micavibrio aeruginosavorus]|uniref:Uncharacterized protein n=1 Tax=Micavibrio aeruginosavorus TaxID=349221 RepID=A0A2W4ZZC6_9BACT|nr:MAG: hypothetical protein DI626_03500 [Micavibrio aeruginosavorus]